MNWLRAYAIKREREREKNDSEYFSIIEKLLAMIPMTMKAQTVVWLIAFFSFTNKKKE